VAALLTIAWLITFFAFPPPGPGTATEHLRDLAAEDFRGSIAFVVVLPLALILAPVWFALAARAWRASPVAAVLAPTFGLLYAPCSLMAYWSQLTVARGLADAYASDPRAAVAAYQLFDFGSTTSFTFALDEGGYAILGLASFAAAVLLRSDGRLGLLAGAALALSGVLSIVGATGLALRVSIMEAGAVASGPPFLVGIVAVAVLLRRGQVAAAPVN
jgi:hypothetical protein